MTRRPSATHTSSEERSSSQPRAGASLLPDIIKNDPIQLQLYANTSHSIFRRGGVTYKLKTMNSYSNKAHLKILRYCFGIILFMSSIVSCKSHHSLYSPITYDIDVPELQLYHSLTLWYAPNTYVENSPSISSYILGTWSISADTLICIPRIIYSENNGCFKYEIMNSKDTSVLSVPQKYLIKKNLIEEVTDYSPILKILELEFGFEPNLGERKPLVLKKR